MSTQKLVFYFVSVILLYFFPVRGMAQSIHTVNIHYRIIDEKMEIFYDLPHNHDTIDVIILFRKKSSPNFRYSPRFLAGDIGVGVFSGSNKKIIWYMKKEPVSLFTGSDFYFVIKAKKIPVKQKSVNINSLKPES